MCIYICGTLNSCDCGVPSPSPCSHGVQRSGGPAPDKLPPLQRLGAPGEAEDVGGAADRPGGPPVLGGGGSGHV